MPTVEELRKVLSSFPAETRNAEELARLQTFFAEMKSAGIAKTREYDLPRPDTIGRSLGEARRKS
jgi:hypothetical protein